MCCEQYADAVQVAQSKNVDSRHLGPQTDPGDSPLPSETDLSKGGSGKPVGQYCDTMNGALSAVTVTIRRAATAKEDVEAQDADAQRSVEQGPDTVSYAGLFR